MWARTGTNIEQRKFKPSPPLPQLLHMRFERNSVEFLNRATTSKKITKHSEKIKGLVSEPFLGKGMRRSRRTRRKALFTEDGKMQKIPQRTIHPNVSIFRGPRMGRWIRGRWICVWGAPDVCPKIVPKPFKIRVLGPLDQKSGRPKNADPTTTDPTPFSALRYLRHAGLCSKDLVQSPQISRLS